MPPPYESSLLAEAQEPVVDEECYRERSAPSKGAYDVDRSTTGSISAAREGVPIVPNAQASCQEY